MNYSDDLRVESYQSQNWNFVCNSKLLCAKCYTHSLFATSPKRHQKLIAPANPNCLPQATKCILLNVKADRTYKVPLWFKEFGHPVSLILNDFRVQVTYPSRNLEIARNFLKPIKLTLIGGRLRDNRLYAHVTANTETYRYRPAKPAETNVPPTCFVIPPAMSSVLIAT